MPEIEKELQTKSTHLTKDNKLRLLRVPQSRFFKDTLKGYIEKEPKIVATRSIDAVREISTILAVACIPTYIMERSTLKAVKPIVKGTRFLGYVEQPFREPTTQDSIEQFLFYLEPNLVFALMQRLPVDIGQVWDFTEEVQNKVNLQANKP